MDNLYFILLKESFSAAVISPAVREPALMAALSFGTHATIVLFALSFAGALLGLLANYGMGAQVERLTHRKGISADYIRVQNGFRKYASWLLILAGIPLTANITGGTVMRVLMDAYGAEVYMITGGLLAILAGWFRLPLKQFLSWICASKIIYFSLLLANL